MVMKEAGSRGSMKMRGMARLGALASATVLTLGVVSAISAASVEPTFHEGNVGVEDCPEGTTGIKIAGGDASGSADGVTVNVTYNDDNSIDFAATGGLVAVAFVKGGDNYNEYAYSPAVASDTNLVSPPVGGDNQNIPAVSHTVFCVVEEPPPSEEPSAPPSEEPSAPPSEEPSAPPSEEPSAPPSEAPSGSVAGETETPSGGVEGETNVPTAPASDIGGNDTSAPGSSLPLLLVVLGIVGLAAVVLTPARSRRR
jgi:hypothetical protein